MHKIGRQLVASPEGNVDLLELVKPSQHSSTGHTSQDIGPGPLHQGHETLIGQDLPEAVEGALVLDTTPGGHHHPPPDGVDGVGHEASGDSDSPAEQEGDGHSGVRTKDQRLEGVVQTEVHPTRESHEQEIVIQLALPVDEDTDRGDGEASVQTLDAVRLESLHVDIDEAVELPLTALALGVIGQPGPGVVQGVDEHQGESPGKPSTGDVGAEFQPLRSVLGCLEGCLDLVFEGKVEGLGGEVSEHIGQVSSPEGVDSLSGQHSLGAVNDAIVGLVQSALLYHLILSNEYKHSGQGEERLTTHLILDEKFDSLNGRRSSLGDPGSNSGQHEVLSKTQLLARHDEESGRLWS